MFRTGEVVFAKVKGWSPWPGKIMCKVANNQFKIFFYGTHQESLVKTECIWSGRDYMEEFSKKHGGKKDYLFALEEMKNSPGVFKVSGSDLCSHNCITCDPKKVIGKPGSVMSGFQRSKSKDVGSIKRSLNYVTKKTKVNVKKVKIQNGVVSKNKSFKEINKCRQRIEKEGKSNRDDLFEKMLSEKPDLDSDQVPEKKDSFEKNLKSKEIIESGDELGRENNPKKLVEKEFSSDTMDDKAEEGIRQESTVKIKKRIDKWFFTANKTTNKVKNLNKQIEVTKSKREKLKFSRDTGKISESFVKQNLPKQIKESPKIDVCGEKIYDESCSISETVQVISPKGIGDKVVPVAWNNNEPKEVHGNLVHSNGSEEKQKLTDGKVTLMDESSSRLKFKYTFKEVVISKTDSTSTQLQSNQFEATMNVAESVSSNSQEEFPEMTQKISGPAHENDLERSITEVWLTDDSDQKERETDEEMQDVLTDDADQNEREIDEVLEDVLELDVSYRMFDLEQQNANLSQESRSVATEDYSKEVMDMDTDTENGTILYMIDRDINPL